MRSIIMLIVCFILLSAFSDQSISYRESGYIPVLMSRAELEKSIRYADPRALTQIGKIYTKDDYIFISQKYKGIHVIDNHDPANPVNAGFIVVPGCLDMSIKLNTMYVDNATDLIAVDLSTIPDLKVTGRIQNVFPELLPPDLTYLPDAYKAANRPENTVIVEWRKSDESVVYPLD
jgi:hypothetical protein